jgi:hypothetical protein
MAKYAILSEDTKDDQKFYEVIFVADDGYQETRICQEVDEAALVTECQEFNSERLALVQLREKKKDPVVWVDVNS